MSNRFRRAAVLAIIVVVVAAGAGTAYAAISGSAPVYRLATVTPSDVTASLHEVGTLSPVHQADVPFAVSGTVKSVAVQPGQAVRAGQKLGSLDATALQAQLTAAQSTLASANLQVHNDEASENAAASNQSSGSASSGSGSSTSAPATSGSHPSSPSLRPLQQAVVAAQRRADSLLAQAKAALAQAKQACGPSPGPSPTPTPSTPAPAPSPTPTATPSPGSPGTPTPSPAGTGSAALEAAADAPSPSPTPPSCAAAEQQVLEAETAVLRAQETLSGRLTALATALARAVAASGTSDPSPGSDPSTGGASGVRVGDAGGAATAAQLAADQAAADAAAWQVTVAQQNLAAATLVSPVSGTVTAVDETVGASASAGSTAFVIAGLDSYDVVASVPVTDMPTVKAGEQASVLPNGTSTPVSGTVVAIGLRPDSTGSATTYPVTIGLTGQPAGLHSGGYASVTITTAHSSGVSVPTSAVHGSGRSATVTVYAGGQIHVVKVKVGTMGPVMTRIISGLKAGQKVVLANLNQPLPTNNLNNQGPGGGRFAGGVRSFQFIG
ncbi:MAG TPA: efflux RND transporter periplasmic adaptor subunit [Streptosporangiaceae bacterium]